MLTDIALHSLLSTKSRQLGVAEIREYAELAADLLGLSPHARRIEDRESLTARAQRAIALQVNALVEAGVEASVYASETVDGYAKTYRDGVILPYALDLARDVLGALGIRAVAAGAYGVIRARR